MAFLLESSCVALGYMYFYLETSGTENGVQQEENGNTDCLEGYYNRRGQDEDGGLDYHLVEVKMERVGGSNVYFELRSDKTKWGS